MTATKAFKPSSKCATCALVKQDKELFARINRSRAFIPGGESLSSILRDYPQISRPSMDNHVHKHQAPNKRQLEKQTKAHETREAFKEIEVAEQERQVKIAERRPLLQYEGNQTSARGELISRLMGEANAGNIKWTGGNIVALLAQEQKAEEAAKDRQFEMEKMVYHFIAQGGKPADYLEYNRDDAEVSSPTDEVIDGETVDGS